MRKGILLLTAVAMILALGVMSITAQDDDAPTLEIGVLPVLNTLPLYVAQSEGFYEEEGVNVELLPFASARDQQIAVQVGEIDGLNTDLAVLTGLVANEFELRAVRSEPINEPYFSILAAPDSGIESLDDLRGVPIAISENTIIEYLTTELLTNAGFSAEDIVYEEVPAIPVRLELLGSGAVQAATLPEPLTTLAANLQGATVLASDDEAAFVPTVLAFTTETLDANPEAITAFLRAYERAVEAINTDGEAYRDVMNENIRIPEPLQATYPIPTFPTSNVASTEQVMLVVDWMVANDLIEETIPYEGLVDDSFLPVIEEAAASMTIAEIAVESEMLTTLVSLLQQAELVETLGEEGPFTVFAPQDSAFEMLDEDMLDALANNPEELANVLTYHVVEGIISAENLESLNNDALETLFGFPITINVTEEGGIMLNGMVRIVESDIDASNGVIHIIDTVLLPQSPE